MDAEIFVVDNNSTDGSKEFFSNRFPQVHFIWKSSNTGFAKANNEAVKLAKGEKILFLNPDTILPEDCFERCLQFFSQQNSIGALGIKMIDGSGNFLPESKRGFPSFFTSFCKMTRLTNLFPHSKIFARYYLGHLPQDKTNEADVLSGAFMMVDKKVLDTVGSFDEDYFMYAEDIDLSYRIQKAGYKNFYFAGTAIIHFKGESVVKQSAAYIRNFYGTMILFIQKHYTGFSKNLYVVLLKVLIGVKSLFAGVSTQGDETRPGDILFVLANDTTLQPKEPELEKYFDQVQQAENINELPGESNVLFCEPSFSFGEMIRLMQQNKNRYHFYIHAKDTRSIVGSNDKDQPGYAIAL
jgi:N-acetylglucosaminyl-diphospho-decaprenol L-rhamnosyltransferase